jgi:hypothetical protein
MPVFKRGFGLTPNKEIPLNDRKPGEIADVAKEQLVAYQIASYTWPIYQEMRSGDTMGRRWVHACRICKQAVWFNSDEKGVAYIYTDEETTTLIVAHIRRCHADMVNEKGEYEYESDRESEVLVYPSMPNASSGGSSNANRPEHQGSDSTGIE